MGSSDRLFNRQRTIHQILGGGLVADVILWRRKNLSKGILVVGLAAWIMFERSGYTFLSYVSNVLLLFTCILFLWSKSASILNRPGPHLPHFHLSEQLVNEMADIFRVRVNTLFSVSRDIALAKDTNMFFKVAAHMLLFSLLGSLTDLASLGYLSLAIILTVPTLYEKCEDHIDGFFVKRQRQLHELYVKLSNQVERCLSELKTLS